MITYDPATMLAYIRSILLPLPGSREGICYGTPGFYAHQKLISEAKLRSILIETWKMRASKTHLRAYTSL